MSKTNGQVNKTTDYSIFKYRGDNRDINATQVTRLVSSIKQDNFLHAMPIIVNANMEVLDGQHRLEAAKKLGVEVYYIVYDVADPYIIIQMNSLQKNWLPHDYVNFYIKNGNDDYRKLKEICKDIGISINNFMLWNGFERYMTDLKAGRYKFDVSDKVIEQIFTFKKLRSLLVTFQNKIKTILSCRNFHRACRKLFNHPAFNADRLFDQVQKCPHLLKKETSVDGYYDQLLLIYNYTRRDRIE